MLPALLAFGASAQGEERTDKVFNHLDKEKKTKTRTDLQIEKIERYYIVAHLEKELVVAVFKGIEAAVGRGPVLDALLKCIHLIRTACVVERCEKTRW